LVARGEAHGVHDAVQAVPLLAQFFEDLGDFFIAGHVARKAQLRVRTPALCLYLLNMALFRGTGLASNNIGEPA
jgi:hypothetical protein